MESLTVPLFRSLPRERADGSGRRFVRGLPAVLAAAWACAAPSIGWAQSGWLPAGWFGRPKPASGEMWPLSEKDGPWLVLATTFRGEGAKDDARGLVQELRDEHGLEAFSHKREFDFTEKPRGLGLNPDGSPKRMRYANEGRVEEWAVLVGSFASVDDPRGQKVLARVKSLEPRSLTGDGGKSRPFADFKRTIGIPSSGKGPMRLAFMMPNPMLPEAYFARPPVDEFVLDMNADVDHSLLDCPGRYSVRVASFTGAGTLDQNAIRSGDAEEQLDNRLVAAAEKAHALTLALRRRGHQAWEFHDRESSIVCVGSFDAVSLPDGTGGQAVNPAVARTIEAFGADPAKLAEGSLVPRSIAGMLLELEPRPIEVPRAATRGGSLTSGPRPVSR
jgi:hypothetical protein